jgi:hypothetical protein
MFEQITFLFLGALAETPFLKRTTSVSETSREVAGPAGLPLRVMAERIRYLPDVSFKVGQRTVTESAGGLGQPWPFEVAE